MKTGRGFRRLRAELTGTALPGADPVQWLEPAEVTDIEPDGSSDGYPLLRLEWRGVIVTAPYLSTYVPTVGDEVLCAYQPPKLLVLGTVVGLA